MSQINRRKYYIKGIHCASCEIFIEKELSSNQKVRSFKLFSGKGEVEIDFDGEPALLIGELNRLFSGQGYIFSDKPFEQDIQGNKRNYLVAFSIALPIIAVFLFLNKTGASSLSLTVGSSLFVFFVFGVVASLSSCAALVGGIVLSMSKKWHAQFGEADSFVGKIKPHLLFNLGRIIAFVLLGALLGAIGNKLQISLSVTSIFVILVSLLMVLFGLQMLGINLLSKLGFTTPKFIKKYIIEEEGKGSQKTPFILGAITVFLPCGFTITVQGIALLSGSALAGALAMLVFVLGTTPILLAIGISSVKFYENPSLAARFSGVAGILVLFFALFNINAQLNVLGYPSFSDINIVSEKKSKNVSSKVETKNSSTKSTSQKAESLKNKETNTVEIVDGKQVIKMQASSKGYSPSSFEVKVGIPARWEITDIGTSGCTNAVIAKGLFEGEISLMPGKTVIKEFTPSKEGNYKFSCWMGMVSGTIRVVSNEGI